MWKEFEVYEGLKAKALIVEGAIADVKIISKIPRRFYYSILNDAMMEAEKLIQASPQTL